jgi:hypothetical protein
MEGKLVLERLHALSRRGYIPLLGERNREANDDVIRLVHPRQSHKTNPVYPVELYDDGTLSVLHFPGRTPYYPEDREKFEAFCRSVPRANFYDQQIALLASKLAILFVFFFGIVAMMWGLRYQLGLAGYDGDTNPSVGGRHFHGTHRLRAPAVTALRVTG